MYFLDVWTSTTISSPFYRCHVDQTLKNQQGLEYKPEEIERQTQYNVVQIEVSFVSPGRDSDKPEKEINISLLSSCYLSTLRDHKTF